MYIRLIVSSIQYVAAGKGNAAIDIDTLVSLRVSWTQKRRGYQDPGVVPLLVFGGISIVLPTVVALMCVVLLLWSPNCIPRWIAWDPSGVLSFSCALVSELPMFYEDLLHLFSWGLLASSFVSWWVFVWFRNRGDAAFIEWVWPGSLHFSLMEWFQGVSH